MICPHVTTLGPQPDRRLWRPKPDVLIHPDAGPRLRRELNTRTEGLPELVIEVLSPTTQKQDLSLNAPDRRVQGKAWGYLELWEVPEYLTFDPLEEFIPGQMRAWRRVNGRTVTWEAGPDGRYASALGVSFAVEGPMLRVYDERGQAVPFDREKNALLVPQDQQLAAQALLLAEERAARRQLEQRLRDLEVELRRLRGDGT